MNTNTSGKFPSDFPERIYTVEEVRIAEKLIDKGYKHCLRIVGSKRFKEKTVDALDLIKIAGYYEIFRTYIRDIIERKGLSQLRESEASIWANEYTVWNKVDAATFFIHKSWQMKQYLKGNPYYGHVAETLVAEVRLEFLRTLFSRSKDCSVRKECKERIKMRNDGIFL